MVLTNCVNCGAPLDGLKCKYCGTEYRDHGVVASFGESDWVGTLTVGDKEFKVYLGSMERYAVDSPDSGRMADGTMYREVLGFKHRFSLIEL